MTKTKFLNGLSYSLAHSYFSTLNYYLKGYMSDWIVNGANDLGIDSVRIDILKKEIQPRELMIAPLLINLDSLKRIVDKTLISNDLPLDFIKEIIFDIKVTEEKRLICSSYAVGINGRTYSSNDYIEDSYERFIAINPPISQKLVLVLKNFYGKFRYLLFRMFKIGKLQYTKRMEN